MIRKASLKIAYRSDSWEAPGSRDQLTGRGSAEAWGKIIVVVPHFSAFNEEHIPERAQLIRRSEENKQVLRIQNCARR